ncbi:galactokinase [Actinocorallia populi]|uniref:galactokinase n=1 Tax=Actinocorallia populi TaxID=2079200 RepID=UPI001E32ABBF|nr:galactokinase [Actinocorallia populi]
MNTWHAPGRVNLIGEHTDYNGGLVLPFALLQGITVEGERRPGRRLELSSGGRTATVPLDGLSPGGVGGWAAYAAGVAGCLIEAGHRIGGAALRFSSDLPQGAGLSSSAALECATAVALRDLFELEIEPLELARIAQRAEHLYAGVPCGLLDQAASMLGRPGHALLMDFRDELITPIPLESGDHRVLVIDTRAEHRHGDGGYADRRASCEKAAALLGVPTLREVSEAPDGLDDPVLRRRVRHVVGENRRVEEAVRLLESGATAEVGPLLTASHASLRDDYGVSWPEADLAVETAVAAGAAGARMVGGGFGGSVIALVASDRIPAVEAAVTAAFAEGGRPAPSFLTAVAGPGARAL